MEMGIKDLKIKIKKFLKKTKKNMRRMCLININNKIKE